MPQRFIPSLLRLLGVVTLGALTPDFVTAQQGYPLWSPQQQGTWTPPPDGWYGPAASLGAPVPQDVVPTNFEVVHAAPAPPAVPTDPYLAEVLQRLETTEARLEQLDYERQQWVADRAALQSSMQEAADKAKEAAEKPKEKSWFEKYRIRGYAQFRINEVMAQDGADAQLVGDSSVGDDQSFIIRRARLIFQGDMSDRVSFYLQPDFASTPNGSVDGIQFVQIRDWYADLHLDDTKIHRFRVGQSKIPYGWENLQSSSNRLPLDRNDALNSAARNERDLGIFYYWTPEYAQETFKYVIDEGLKGSGNYGVFGFGVYNGQGGSLREVNDDLHVISRLAVPYTFDSGQIMELGLQGYTGLYSVYSSSISPLGVGPAVRPFNTIETGDGSGIVDRRLAGTFVWYPQPLGFQAEWTVGRGPGLNEEQTAVIDRPLYGGYLMTMYRYETECRGEFIPFARWNYYKGGYKSERNAPFVDIDEWEAGVEWQISKYVELVTMYTITDRTNTRAISSANTASYEQFEGQLLRFQLQVNY